MRKGFTLVELIFVIVIIGILAAAAIPQFKNLKQNAEANNIVKTTVDTASAAASAAVNQMDLEDENLSTSANGTGGIGLGLEALVRIGGQGWTYTHDSDIHDGAYTYKGANDTGDVAQVVFYEGNRTISYGISCSALGDALSVTKCQKIWNSNDGNVTVPVSLSF